MTSFLTFPIKKEDDIVPLPSIHPKRKTAIANIPPRARFAKARPNIRVGGSKAKNSQPTQKEFENIVAKVEKGSDISDEPQILNTVSNSNEGSLLLENGNIVPKEEKDIETIKIPKPSNATLNEDVVVVEKQTRESTISPKKEPELFQKPSLLPKRSLGLPIAPRARYQKARPNIAALVNKTPKDVNTQKGSGPASGTLKDIADSTKPKKLLSEVDNEKESTADSDSNKDQNKEGSDMARISLKMGEKECSLEASPIEPAVPNNIDINQATANQRLGEDQDGAMTEPQSISNVNNSHAEKNIVLNEEEELVGDTTEQLATVEKQGTSSLIKKKSKLVCEFNEPVLSVNPPTPTPSVLKPMEYPTLKSILNSPRKRTTTKKVYERKRRLANLSEKPSRSEMTMTDLIYFNPAGEPMKTEKPKTGPVENLLPADENTKPVEEEPEEENSTPVPKVIINENGEIIIDESSLVVRRKETVDTSVEAIIENDNTTYSSFRKRSSKQWTNKETSKFYKALSLVGTDFALMENIFTVDGKVTRSRRELKLKFKREEKLRLELVHRAMYETQTYDISILQEDDLDEVITEQNVDDAPKILKKRGRKPKDDGNQSKSVARKKRKKTSDDDCLVDETEEAVYTILEQELNEKQNGEVNSKVSEGELNDRASSKPEVSRPQRIRKTRILSDYVTDADDSDNSEDYLPDNNCKLITNPEETEINLENETEVSESINGNGESIQIEKPLKARKRKKAKVLSTDSSEPPDIDSPLPAAVTEVSRLGRVRKLKVLPDFITDDVALEEADGENDTEFESHKSQVTQMEVANKAVSDTQIVIPKVTAAADQDVVCMSVIKSPRVQDSIDMQNSQRTDQKNNLTQNRATDEGTSAKTDLLSPTAVISSKDIGNLLQFPFLQQQNSSNSVENLLTDAVISEVVTTDMKTTMTKKVRRRPAMPNLTRGKQRPRIGVETPHIQPSFSNFTPAEELISPDTVIKTYSRRQLHSKQQTSVDQTVPDRACPNVETITIDSASTSQNNQVCDTVAQAFESPSVATTERASPLSNQTATSVHDIETITLDSGTCSRNDQTCWTSTQRNINSGTAFQSTNLLSGTSFPQAYQNVPRTNQNPSDPPPVMIFTKSPNNENILHLFVMKSPDQNF